MTAPTNTDDLNNVGTQSNDDGGGGATPPAMMNDDDDNNNSSQQQQSPHTFNMHLWDDLADDQDYDQRMEQQKQAFQHEQREAMRHHGNEVVEEKRQNKKTTTTKHNKSGAQKANKSMTASISSEQLSKLRHNNLVDSAEGGGGGEGGEKEEGEEDDQQNGDPDAVAAGSGYTDGLFSFNLFPTFNPAGWFGYGGGDASTQQQQSSQPHNTNGDDGDDTNSDEDYTTYKMRSDAIKKSNNYRSRQTGVVVDKDNSKQIRRKLKRALFGENPNDLGDVKLNKHYVYKDPTPTKQPQQLENNNNNNKKKQEEKENVVGQKKQQSNMSKQQYDEINTQYKRQIEQEDEMLTDMSSILTRLTTNSTTINTQLREQENILGVLDVSIEQQQTTFERLYDQMDQVLAKDNTWKYYILLLQVLIVVVLLFLLVSWDPFLTIIITSLLSLQPPWLITRDHSLVCCYYSRYLLHALLWNQKKGKCAQL